MECILLHFHVIIFILVSDMYNSIGLVYIFIAKDMHYEESSGL